MTNEEAQRYIEIGLSADVLAKANHVQATMNHLRVTFERASGMYVPSRFSSAMASMHDAMNEFEEAMKKREAHASARTKAGAVGAPHAETRRDVPVAGSDGTGPSATLGVDMPEPRDASAHVL